MTDEISLFYQMTIDIICTPFLDSDPPMAHCYSRRMLRLGFGKVDLAKVNVTWLTLAHRVPRYHGAMEPRNFNVF